MKIEEDLRKELQAVKVSIVYVRLKMADSVGRKVSFSSSPNNKLSVNRGDLCLYCDELRSELQKTQLELLSYEKVINVLQEEIKNLELRLYPDCISQSDYGEVQLQRLKTENNRTQRV
jgi:hypothetical protein